MTNAELPASAEVEEAHLRSLLAAWELGAVARISRATGGATHRVYRVESESGVWFLRVYKRPDVELARREHGLIAYARACGLPCLPPLAARRGGTVVEHGGLVAALYPAAPGRQLTSSELGLFEARAAGALLGELHRALAPLHDAGDVRWTLSWEGAAWLERLNVVERALLARGVVDETDRWALERLQAQRSWLGEESCVHRYAPRAPAQVVHGDYQEGNLFFEHASAAGVRVSGVIDWDQAAFLPRGYEVARACSFLFQLEPERTQSFVGAYRSQHPIADDELDDGARAWGAFSDHHVWPLEEVYLQRNEAARRYIPHAPFRPFHEAWASAVASRDV